MTVDEAITEVCRRHKEHILWQSSDIDDVLVAEIKRLRAITDHLPLTADGVRVAEGPVYATVGGAVHESGMIEVEAIGCEFFWRAVFCVPSDGVADYEDVQLSVSECYSTQQAAETAAKARES